MNIAIRQVPVINGQISEVGMAILLFLGYYRHIWPSSGLFLTEITGHRGSMKKRLTRSGKKALTEPGILSVRELNAMF